MSAVGLALRQCGVTETTSITVLTDGDAGLQAVHQQVAPEAEHVLDWFHIAMKFTNLQQLAKGVDALTDGGVRSHALAELERAKWRFWNGRRKRGLIGLVHLMQWARAQCFDHIPSLKKLEAALSGGKLAESGPCTVDLNTRWSAVTQYLLAHTFTIGSSAVLPLSGDMPPLTWVVSQLVGSVLIC